MNTITLASTVDENFLPYVGPVAASIGHFAVPGRPIDYRVFYSGPDSADTRALDGYRVGPLTVRLIPAPPEFKRFEGRSKMGTATLVRLSAGELMPDVDRVLFLDVDLFARDDVGTLFDADLGGKPLGAVRDFTLYVVLGRQDLGEPSDPKWAIRPYLDKVIGLAPQHWWDYVNTGVGLMDLALLRSEDFGRRAIGLLDVRADELLWPDQDAFNILLPGRIAFLDSRWNVQVQIVDLLNGGLSRDLSPVIISGAQAQARAQGIVHFPGTSKPWEHTSHVPFSGDWWHFAKSSPTYGSILDNYRKLRRRRRRLPNPRIPLARLFASMKYARAAQ